MNIAYVLVQSTIGHEMEVLHDLLKIELVKTIVHFLGFFWHIPAVLEKNVL